MPRTRHAPGKRRRASKTSTRRLRQVAALALDMEEPLADAARYVHALRLIGNGLTAMHDEGGEPIAAIACAAAARLDTLTEQWRRMFKAARARADGVTVGWVRRLQR